MGLLGTGVTFVQIEQLERKKTSEDRWREATTVPQGPVALGLTAFGALMATQLVSGTTKVPAAVFGALGANFLVNTGKQLFSFLVGAVFHFSSELVSISFSPPFPFLRLHFSISISPLPLHVCISILPFLHYSFHFSSSVYCSSSIPPFLQSDCRNCERAMACALTSKSSRQITFGAQNHGPHYSSIATYMPLSC